MAIAGKKLQAFAKQQRGPLQRGVKGGTYYVTASGEKVYTDKEPTERTPKATGPAVAAAQSAGAAQSKGIKMQPVKTKPLPKVGGRPGGGAGAQLPAAMQARLKELGVGKLPAAHIKDVFVSPSINSDSAAHTGALLKWKDDKGKVQSAYTREFDRRNAEKKWARVIANRPKVEAAIADMAKKAQSSHAHAAALLMAQTALRPGSEHSVAKEGHFGATTIQARHVKFAAGAAHLEFIGKQGKLNKATVTDPALVNALREAVKGKKPGDRVWDTDLKAIREAAPKGVKLKDFRTIAATKHAEAELKNYAFKSTGDAKKDARQVLSILKAVSTTVSQRLNNTPAMARKSYIAPQVIRAWGKQQFNLKPEWLEL